MAKNIFTSLFLGTVIFSLVFCDLSIAAEGISEPADNISADTAINTTADVDADTADNTLSQKKYCTCWVTITQDDDRRSFLLTFHFETRPNESGPVFYMNEQIAGGLGLKVRKIFDGEEKEIKVCGDMVPEIRDGKIIYASSKPYPESSLGYFDAFNGRDGRKLLLEQRVFLQGRFPTEEGFYAVSYEHPWQEIEGTNVKFFSNTLLVSVTSWQRSDELHAMFRNNPELEFARYRMTHPANSEYPNYSRPLKFFDEYIQVGMPYDEVLYLMGSPDSVGQEYRNWFYETSPVGGFWVRFENGKVSSKGFSFDSDSP